MTKNIFRGTVRYVHIFLPIVMILFLSGCAEREKQRTYEGKLVSVFFEHRNVAEHKGEGGPEITLLVTRGRTEGAILEDGVKVFYSVDGGPFESMLMEPSTSGRRYIAELPAQKKGSVIRYYIKIDHRLGKTLTFPEDAKSDHYFTIHIS